MPYIVLDPAAAAAAPATTLGAPRTNEGETLASMISDLKLQLGRPELTDPQVTTWINRAYIDLWTSLDLEESYASYSFPLVAGQALYKVPSIVSTTIGAALVDDDNENGGWPIEKIDLKSYRMLPDKEGEPFSYFRTGDMLVLYPTPEKVQTVVVDFRMIPLDLTEPAHSPILSREWHESIILNARKKGFSALREFDKAMPAQNEYIQSVRVRQDEDAIEQRGRVVRSSVPRSGKDLSRKHYGPIEPE